MSDTVEGRASREGVSHPCSVQEGTIVDTASTILSEEDALKSAFSRRPAARWTNLSPFAGGKAIPLSA